MSAAFVNACPSTISLMAVAVVTHWTVCHAPSFRAGPATRSLEPPEPFETARRLSGGLVLDLELAAGRGVLALADQVPVRLGGDGGGREVDGDGAVAARSEDLWWHDLIGAAI